MGMTAKRLWCNKIGFQEGLTGNGVVVKFQSVVRDSKPLKYLLKV